MTATDIETSRVMSGLKTVTRDAEEMLKTVSGESGGNGSHAMRARLSTAIESAKETYQRLQAKAIAGAKATDKAVRGHPYESLGVAFGVGLLVGVLVRRK
jgi:ElaB/YqjD/DUF883 family membrane-anchored ribosome-binding protein